jgi:hypothetical protein
MQSIARAYVLSLGGNALVCMRLDVARLKFEDGKCGGVLPLYLFLHSTPFLLFSFSPFLLFSFSPFLLFSFSPFLLFSFSPFPFTSNNLPQEKQDMPSSH